MITLAYPTKVHQISKPRGSVLYYISGYVLSKVWTHKRRRNLSNPEWDDVVTSNHSKCSAAAIERNPELVHMVGVVDQRNDPVNGAGLLYPTLEWFEFVFALENGYYHILSQPVFLGAFLGDLPTEILRVVSGSAVVKERWAKCCPIGGDSKVLDEVFKFVVGKFHNVRMGDFSKSLSANSSLRQSKGELALRQQLKAGTAKDGAGTGVSSSKVQNGGGAEGVVTLAAVKRMTDDELNRFSKDKICEIINTPGGVDHQKGIAKPWRPKPVLLAWLKLKASGADAEPAEIHEVDGAGNENEGPADHGAVSGKPDVADTRTTRGDDGGHEWVDLLPFKDIDINNMLADIAERDESNGASTEDFPYDFCGRPILLEDLVTQVGGSDSTGAVRLGVVVEDELFEDVFLPGGQDEGLFDGDISV
ncbi:unnamed protein product [Scytosiphon promiscuus]